MRTIALTQSLFAIVDDADYERLALHKWFAHRKGRAIYACRKIRRKMVGMHTVLLPHAALVDHVNGNGLDNRRCNIRPVTRAQNQHNWTKKARDKSSQYRGVSWKPSHGKWCARIKNAGRTTFLGYFESEIDAAKAYDRAGFARDSEHFTPNIKGT